jgi:hypothetical protein
MKNVTYFFILFLLTLTTPLFADKNSNEEVLKRLDRVIDRLSCAEGKRDCGFKATSSPF